jgi:exopolysaccharide biosynthesis polyprenyl glycosylphosphotransferase
VASDAQSLPFQGVPSAALVQAEPVPIRPGTSGHREVALPAPGRSLLRARLMVVDVLAVTLSWIAVGYGLLHGSTAERLGPGIAAAAATLVAMRGTGLYRSRLCVRRSDELWRIFLSSLWGAAAFVVVQWQTGTPGSEVLVAMTACVLVTGACRWQFARWLRARRADGRYLRNVVLVGANEDAVALHTMLRSEPELGYQVTAVVGARGGDPAWRDVRTGWSMADIPRLAADSGASGILVVPYALSSEGTERALAVAANAGLHVQVWPGFRGVGSGRLRNVPVSGEAFFYVEPRPSARWQFGVKRAIDVIGAAFVLTVTAPVIAVAALAVKLEDGGPVLYRDERVGLHGETFRICKLRSMSVTHAPSADELAALNERTDGPLFKASQDPRVTRVGRLIRASSIDELPQLWNVLRGTMSLVGPRPALPDEVSQFDEDFQRRHSVRPGVTGLWQVEARHNPSFNAYRRLDLRYIDNWSLALDLSIILVTVPAVFSQALRSLLRHTRRS